MQDVKIVVKLADAIDTSQVTQGLTAAINSLQKTADSNPIKIKLSLNKDSLSRIKDLQKALSNMSGSNSATKNMASDMHNVEKSAGEAAKSTERMTTAAKRSAPAMKQGTAAYNKRMRDVRSTLTSVEGRIRNVENINPGTENDTRDRRELLSKYNSAKDSLTELRRAMEKGILDNEKLTVEKYENRIQQIKADLAEFESSYQKIQSKFNGNDGGIGTDTAKYQSNRKAISDERNKINSKIRELEKRGYSEADDTSAGLYASYKNQLAALDTLNEKLKSGALTNGEYENSLKRIKAELSELSGQFDEVKSKASDLKKDSSASADSAKPTSNKRDEIIVQNSEDALRKRKKISKSIAETEKRLAEAETYSSASFGDKDTSAAINQKAIDLVTQYTEKLKELKSLQSAVDSGNITHGEYTDKYSKAVNDIEKLNDELKVLSKNSSDITMTKGAKETEAQLKKISSLRQSIERNTANWTSARDGLSKVDYSNLINQLERLKKLYADVSNGNITKADAAKEFQAISTEVAASNRNIAAAGENTKSWGDHVGSLAGKFNTWLTISQVVMKGYEVGRKIVDTVIDVDTAMTELKKVTNETSADYDKFLDRAGDRAQKLGAELTDTVNATADFARLGYSVEDAEKLSDAAIVYKNVGDGIQDIGEASESVIATMKAFNIPAEQAMTIVDKFNDAGNRYAISSAGVGEALLRSAAAMKAANNSLDETIALAVGANEVTQDPEKVGTVLKTVSMYLRAAKTEAEDAGESTDGMASSVSKLRAELLALTGGKVDIQSDEDTYKSTYQILKEMSAVWHDLTDISQANILEMLGGKRNSNVLAALLENFSTAEKVVETSANSAGSALEENEKVIESTQGKINQFKATFQSLSTSFIDSSTLSEIVSLGTKLLGIVEGIVKALDNPFLHTIFGGVGLSALVNHFGGYKGILSGIGGFFKNSQIGSMVKQFKEIDKYTKGKGNGGIVGTIKSLFSKNSELKMSADEYIEAAKAVAEGTATIQQSAAVAAKSFKSNLWMMGISLAITAISAGIAEYKKKIEEAKKAAEDVRTEWTKAQESYKNSSGILKDNESDFRALSLGVDDYGRNISLATEQYEKYQGIISQITGLYPELIAGHDEENNILVKKAGLLERVADLQEQAYRKEAWKSANNEAIEKLVKGDGYSVSDAVSKLRITAHGTKEDNIMPWYAKSAITATINSIGIDKWIYASDEQIKKWLSGALRRNSQMTPERAQATVEANFDNYKQDLREQLNYLREYANKLDETFMTAASLADGYNNLSGSKKNFVTDTIGKIDATLLSEEQAKSARNQIMELVGALNGDGFSGVDFDAVSRVEELNTAMQNGEMTISQYNERINESGDGYKNLGEKIVGFLKTRKDLAKGLGMDANGDGTIDDEEIEAQVKVKFNIDKKDVLSEFRDVVSGINSGVNFKAEAEDDFKEMVDGYNAAFQGATVPEIKQTVFGNIDTNARNVLKWTDANINMYRNALESWGYTADEIEKLKGEMSTVMGTSAEFDGVSIAFSPMLQLPNGQAELLDSDTVYAYIQDIVDKLKSEGKEITLENVLRLDTKGLVADVGDTAKSTAERMHFQGKDGAYVQASEAKAEAEAIQNWYDGLSDEDKELVYKLRIVNDTSDWTLQGWQKQLNDLNAGTDEAKEKLEELNKVFNDKTDLSAFEKFTAPQMNKLGEMTSKLSQGDQQKAILAMRDLVKGLDARIGGTGISGMIEAMNEAEPKKAKEYATAIESVLNGISNATPQLKPFISTLKEMLQLGKVGIQDFSDIYTDTLSAIENGGQTKGIQAVQSALDAVKSGLEDGKVNSSAFNASIDMLFGENRPKNLSKALEEIQNLFGAGEDGLEGMYNTLRKYSNNGELDLQKLRKELNLSDAAFNALRDNLREQGLLYANKQDMNLIGDGLGIDNDRILDFESRARELTNSFKNGENDINSYRESVEQLIKEYGLGSDAAKVFRKNMEAAGMGEYKVGDETGRGGNLTAFTGIGGKEADDIEALIGKSHSAFKDSFSKADHTIEPDVDFDTDPLKEQIREKLKAVGEYTDAEIEEIASAITNREKKIRIRDAVDIEYNKVNLSIPGLDTNDILPIKEQVKNAIMEGWNDKTGTFDLGKIKASISGLEVVQNGTISAEDILKQFGFNTDEDGNPTLNGSTGMGKLVVGMSVDGATQNLQGVIDQAGNLQTILGQLNDTPINITIGGDTAEREAQAISLRNTLQEMVNHGAYTIKVNYESNTLPVPSIPGTNSGNNDNNGGAKVYGTAFAGGNWGAKDSGNALMGELGYEVRVRDGRYEVIGENGAEFADYRKGDIIFNHEQSKQLLEQGKITRGKRRGKAFVSGNIPSSIGANGSSGKNSSKKSNNSKPKGSSKDDEAQKIDETKSKIALEKLKKAIDDVSLSLEYANSQIDAFQNLIDRAGDFDYGTKIEAYSNMLDLASQNSATLYSEFERLRNIMPANAEEAKELSSRMETLGKDIIDNAKNIQEYSKNLDMVMVDAAKASTENIDTQLNNASTLLDRSVKRLTENTLFGAQGAFDTSFLLPSLPQDSIDKKRKENEKILELEKWLQKEIYNVKKRYSDMEYAENMKDYTETLNKSAKSKSSSSSSKSSSADEADSTISQSAEAATAVKETGTFKLIDITDYDSFVANMRSVLAIKISNMVSAFTSEDWKRIVNEHPLSAFVLDDSSWSELDAQIQNMLSNLSATSSSVKDNTGKISSVDAVQDITGSMSAIALNPDESSWDALGEDMQSRVENVYGLTQTDWETLCLTQPLIAASLKLTGDNSWDSRYQQLNGGGGLIPGMMQGAANVVSGTRLPAPGFNTTAYQSLGNQMGQTIAAAIQNVVNRLIINVPGISYTGQLMGFGSDPDSLGALGNSSSILAAAQNEVNTNGGKLPKNNRYTGGVAEAWCGDFVNYCARAAGIQAPSQRSVISGASSMASLGLYRSSDSGYIPQPGDFIYFDWNGAGGKASLGALDHVGIVESVDPANGIINTIEGNTGNSSLARKRRAVSSGSIAGYGITAGLPRYEAGTAGAVGGHALVGEKGRELAIFPNGQVAILGKNGAEIVDIPQNTHILPNPDTERVLSYTGSKVENKPIAKYANGTISPEKIASYIRANYTEITDAGIAAILGNIQQESSFDPKNKTVEPYGSGSNRLVSRWGLFQLDDERIPGWSDIVNNGTWEQQIDRMLQEARFANSGMGDSKAHDVWTNVLTNAAYDAATAAKEFDRLYERSDGKSRDKRAENAEEYLKQMRNGTIALNANTSATNSNTTATKSQEKTVSQRIAELTKTPSSYSPEFIDSYMKYASRRSQTTALIGKARERGETQEASDMSKILNLKDIEQALSMQLDLYTQSVKIYEEQYKNLEALYNEYAAKGADASVLSEIITAMSDVSDKINDTGDKWQDTVDKMGESFSNVVSKMTKSFSEAITSADRSIKSLEHTLDGTSDFAARQQIYDSLITDSKKQADSYKNTMDSVHRLAQYQRGESDGYDYRDVTFVKKYAAQSGEELRRTFDYIIDAFPDYEEQFFDVNGTVNKQAVEAAVKWAAGNRVMKTVTDENGNETEVPADEKSEFWDKVAQNLSSFTEKLSTYKVAYNAGNEYVFKDLNSIQDYAKEDIKRVAEQFPHVVEAFPDWLSQFFNPDGTINKQAAEAAWKWAGENRVMETVTDENGNEIQIPADEKSRFWNDVYNDLDPFIQTVSSDFTSILEGLPESYKDITSKYTADIIEGWFDGNGDISQAGQDFINNLTDQNEKNRAVSFITSMSAYKKLWLEAEDGFFEASDNIRNYSEKQVNEQIDEYKTLSETILDMIEQNYQEEQKIYENAHNAKMEQIEEERNAIEKSYNRQIELLQDLKSEETYNDDLSQLTKEADNLRAKINALSLQGDIASNTERLELEKQLRDKQEEIAKKQRDHEYDKKVEALQDDLEKQQDYYQDLSDTEDKYYEWQQEMLEKRYSQTERYNQMQTAMATQTFDYIKSTGEETYASIAKNGVSTSLALSEAYDKYATETGQKFEDLGSTYENMIHRIEASTKLLNFADTNGKSYLRMTATWSTGTTESLDGTDGTVTSEPTGEANNTRSWGTGNNGVNAGNASATEVYNKVVGSGTDSATKQLRGEEYERILNVITNRLKAGQSIDEQISYLAELISAANAYGITGITVSKMQSKLRQYTSDNYLTNASDIALSNHDSVVVQQVRGKELSRALEVIAQKQKDGRDVSEQLHYLRELIDVSRAHGILGYNKSYLDQLYSKLDLSKYHSGKNKEELAVILDNETVLPESDVALIKDKFGKLSDIIGSFANSGYSLLSAMTDFTAPKVAATNEGGNYTYHFNFDNVNRNDIPLIKASVLDVLRDVDKNGINKR